MLLVPVSSQEQAPRSLLLLLQECEPCGTSCVLSACTNSGTQLSPAWLRGDNWTWSDQRSLNHRHIHESKIGVLVLKLAAGHKCRQSQQQEVLSGTPS